MARAKNHYVNNKKMNEALTIWKAKVKAANEAGTVKPRVPEYIGECIYLIATNLAHKPNFRNYSFVEEMIGDGYENCLLYIENYNPEYQSPIGAKPGNAFAYFTQIIYYAFLRRIRKEKQQTYIKHKIFVHDMTFNNLVEGATGEGDHFDSVKITYDPEKMAALEEIFEKKKPAAIKKKSSGLDILLDDDEDEETLS